MSSSPLAQLWSEFWFLVVRDDQIESASEGFIQNFDPAGNGAAVVGSTWWSGLALDEPEAARAWRAEAASGGAAAHYARAGGGARWLRLQTKGGGEP